VTFRIRTTTGDDWREIRELRLEALADTPMAFGETLATAIRHTDDTWRMRGRRGTATNGTLLAAIDDETGRWVGTMGGFLADGNPLLVGVYVTPSHRGRSVGVFDALLDRVEEWARTHGSTLTLHVHTENVRAQSAYARSGFVPTGLLIPYELNPVERELEMVKQL
jgi:GNAT superfamily N-acetyltransferase